MNDLAMNMDNRIIIIDDNPSVHEDFKAVLAPSSEISEIDELSAKLFDQPIPPQGPQKTFRLNHALQGQDGLEQIRKARLEDNPFCVAFVDMRMPPGWDGLQTIQEIWKADSFVQVVICTAYADHSLDDIIQHLGVTDSLLILKKPFDAVEVTQMAIALSVKWEMAKMIDFNMAQLQLRVNEQDHELKIAKDQVPKSLPKDH